ncbi:MAG: shikimate dehydrogenase [Bdellovibrionota bacterium]
MKKVQPQLSGKTAVYAVLGDPVEHSLSPVFQNEAFRAAGIDACYVPMRVAAKDLSAAITGLSHTSLKGFNATVPLKEALVPLCTKLTDEARLIGAVNTVELDGGKIVGHNTDGRGFLESLKEETKFQPRGKKACVVGSGGAARAIICALTKAGVREIVICNRTPAKGKQLASDLAHKLHGMKLGSSSLRMGELSRAFEGVSLVVQATPVGLEGRGLIPLPWGVIPKGTLVADIVYQPQLTPLLSEAKRRGLPTLGGVGMLVHQGALSFEIWTGKKPDLKRMRQVVEHALANS